MLEMFEILVVLRDESVQKTKHVRFYVRVGILIYRQAARSMLREQNANAFFCVGFADNIFDFARNINHFFALHGSSEAQKWLDGMNHSEWFLFHKTEAKKYGPLALSAVAEALENFPHALGNVVVICRGLTTMGFFAEQVLPVLPRSGPGDFQSICRVW